MTMGEYQKGFEVGLAAGRAAAGVAEWKPIETAPPDELLLLGWWQKWPELHWEEAIALACSTSGGWRHGCATHWQKLPSPPPHPHSNDPGQPPKHP
jgi:hypothetical protein